MSRKKRTKGFKAEVEALLQAGDWKELEDRFYRDLEFGTGGLRGVIGGGYNRMNSLVVGRATQGLCDYVRKAFPGKSLSACIAYDSRRCSASFSEIAARVFAANGIKAYLFSGGAAHAGALLRDPAPESRHGHRGHGEPQSAQVQRLQGLLERRLPGHAPPRRGHHPHGRGSRGSQVDLQGRGPREGPPRRRGQGGRRALRRDGEVQAPQARAHQGDGTRGEDRLHAPARHGRPPLRARDEGSRTPVVTVPEQREPDGASRPSPSPTPRSRPPSSSPSSWARR